MNVDKFIVVVAPDGAIKYRSMVNATVQEHTGYVLYTNAYDGEWTMIDYKMEDRVCADEVFSAELSQRLQECGNIGLHVWDQTNPDGALVVMKPIGHKGSDWGFERNVFEHRNAEGRTFFYGDECFELLASGHKDDEELRVHCVSESVNALIAEYQNTDPQCFAYVAEDVPHYWLLDPIPDRFKVDLTEIFKNIGDRASFRDGEEYKLSSPMGIERPILDHWGLFEELPAMVVERDGHWFYVQQEECCTDFREYVTKVAKAMEGKPLVRFFTDGYFVSVYAPDNAEGRKQIEAVLTELDEPFEYGDECAGF